MKFKNKQNCRPLGILIRKAVMSISRCKPALIAWFHLNAGGSGDRELLLVFFWPHTQLSLQMILPLCMQTDTGGKDEMYLHSLI